MQVRWLNFESMVFEINSKVGKTLSLFSIWPFHIDSTQAIFRFLYDISDYFERKTANEKDMNNITLTKALVVKNAAFIRLKFFAETSVCW